MNYIKSRHTGFSLIELLLVLVVIAFITIASFRQFERYRMRNKTEQIRGSVAYLMDLLTRYYQATCQDLDKTFHDKTVVKNDFVSAGIVDSNVYDAMVKFPWKKASYTMSLEWKLEEVESAKHFSSPNVDDTPVTWGVWLGTVTFTFPADINSNMLDAYAALLQPGTVDKSSFLWHQPVNLGWGKIGGLTPMTEDLNRFSVQTYVPDTPHFYGDYDSSYRPSESTQPCSVLERQQAAKDPSNPDKKYLDEFEEVRQIR